jgi:N-methylhydantoinase A
VLYAYGGAGPVHAGRYAAELGIKQIVVPPTAAVQGGMGLISSDVAYEFGMSDQVKFPTEPERMNQNFGTLIERARRELAAAGFRDEEMVIQRSLDMRYRFQTHELNVPLPAGTWEITEAYMNELDTLFDDLYEQAYGQGSGYREAGKDIITFRVRAMGKLKKPQLKALALNGSDASPALKERRPVFFQEYNDFTTTAIYQFEQVTPGMELAGPAVIESPITTIVINPQDRARMDEYRNVRIAIGG